MQTNTFSIILNAVFGTYMVIKSMAHLKILEDAIVENLQGQIKYCTEF